MCSVKAPPPVEVEKPVFLRNPYLDEVQSDVKTAAALRRGRSSLVIPTNTSIGTSGRGGATGAAGTGRPAGNSANPITGFSSGGSRPGSGGTVSTNTNSGGQISGGKKVK